MSGLTCLRAPDPMCIYVDAKNSSAWCEVCRQRWMSVAAESLSTLVEEAEADLRESEKYDDDAKTPRDHALDLIHVQGRLRLAAVAAIDAGFSREAFVQFAEGAFVLVDDDVIEAERAARLRERAR